MQQSACLAVNPITVDSYGFLFNCTTVGQDLKRKRKLVALLLLLLLSYRCIVTLNVLWLLLTVPLVGLHYVIVVFPDHTHLLFIAFY